LKATDLIPLTALHMAAASPHTASITPVQVQTDMATLDSDLATVETALAVPLGTSGYTYTITNPNNAQQSYKIGTAELESLDASVEVLRAVLNLGLVYNADDSNYSNGNSLAQTVFATQLATARSTIAPSSYLPGAPFLTLESDGRQRASNVSSQLTSAANNAVAAINNVESRNNSGYLLDPGTVITTAQLNSASSQVQQYKAYLTSPQTFSQEFGVEGTHNVTIAVGSFLNNPPSNLTAFWPTLTTGVDPDTSMPDFYEGTNAYPDTTFGGLFPSGLTEAEVIGPSAVLDVNSSVTVSDLAEPNGFRQLD